MGWVGVVGEAGALAMGGSLNASMATETFGVDGMSGGSENGRTFGSQVES